MQRGLLRLGVVVLMSAFMTTFVSAGGKNITRVKDRRHIPTRCFVGSMPRVIAACQGQQDFNLKPVLPQASQASKVQLVEMLFPSQGNSLEYIYYAMDNPVVYERYPYSSEFP